MSTGLEWVGPISKTRHRKVVLIHQGRSMWRTAAKDDDGSWTITGPPYVSKWEANAAITEEWLWSYFGDEGKGS